MVYENQPTIIGGVTQVLLPGSANARASAPSHRIPDTAGQEMKIKVKRLNRARGGLKKATDGSAGFDLRAGVAAVLAAGSRRLIPTGLAFELPPGMEGQIRPRSGLADARGVTVLNSPGTIDSDYRGEVGVILINHGSNPFHVNVGDRIAQIVFAHVADVEIEEVRILSKTEREAGGFGSSVD